MKQLKCLLLISFALLSYILNAQHIAAYNDYKNYFYTFYDGTRTELEYLPIQSFQVGGNAVAYSDNKGSFKVFNNGKVTTLSDNPVSQFSASDYLVSYSTYQILNVFDNGKVTPLSVFSESYTTGDSMVAFYEARRNSYKIYYNGSVTTLEDGINGSPLQSFEMGDNVFAFVNYLNHFKLFYRGETIKLATVNRSLPYKAGKNIVAYCNDTYGFSIFYKGLIYDLEALQPKSFAAGDDFAAYVTLNDQLNVFYDGKMQVISTFEPSFYKVVDSLLVYSETQKFKVFYKGAIYTLENYVPENYQIDFNTIAYLDQQGRLKTFHDGKTTFVTNSRIDDFELYRNVISYKVYNRNYIYYNSKTYNQ